MKSLCRLGWHRWRQWVLVPITIDGKPPMDGKSYQGGQMRSCCKCGRFEVEQFPVVGFQIQVSAPEKVEG